MGFSRSYYRKGYLKLIFREDIKRVWCVELGPLGNIKLSVDCGVLSLDWSDMRRYFLLVYLSDYDN